jgi:hypothetical protein
VRTWLRCLVGSLAVVLAAGTATAAATPSEGQVASAIHVTGRLISVRYDHADEARAAAGEGQHMRGLLQVQDIAWSDPRLPSQMLTRINIDGYFLEDSEGVLPFTGTHRLDGRTGSWSGTQHGVLYADGCDWQDVLVGEGAYHGLFAVLVGRMVVDATGVGRTEWEGYIFEGEPPPLPETLPVGSLDRRPHVMGKPAA